MIQCPRPIVAMMITTDAVAMCPLPSKWSSRRRWWIEWNPTLVPYSTRARAKWRRTLIWGGPFLKITYKFRNKAPEMTQVQKRNVFLWLYLLRIFVRIRYIFRLLELYSYVIAININYVINTNNQLTQWSVKKYNCSIYVLFMALLQSDKNKVTTCESATSYKVANVNSETFDSVPF